MSKEIFIMKSSQTKLSSQIDNGSSVSIFPKTSKCPSPQKKYLLSNNKRSSRHWWEQALKTKRQREREREDKEREGRWLIAPFGDKIFSYKTAIAKSVLTKFPDCLTNSFKTSSYLFMKLVLVRRIVNSKARYIIYSFSPSPTLES